MNTFTTTNMRPSYASFGYDRILVPCCPCNAGYHNEPRPKPEYPYVKTMVEIKKVPDYSDTGRVRIKWGAELTVGRKKIQVPIGNKAQLMIYVCTLLRICKNDHMYLHEFYNNSQGRYSKYTRDRSRVWMKSVYDFLYRGDCRCYDDWAKKNQDMNDLGRPLHQAKSSLNHFLKAKLQGQPEYIVEKFLIESVSKKRDTYYDIKIRPKNIIVPQELQELCDGFYGMKE